jgi:hypothetical protein
MTIYRGTMTAVWLAALPTAALAQAQAPVAQGGAQPRSQAATMAAQDAADEEITVTGQREPGAVVGDIKPETQLNAGDIRSFGVSTVSELLTELTPQTTSGRGNGEAPVVLLNGKRISGMNEIRDIPTEAIRRVDILPEEVALKYGYPANQKVVNIVLRPRFRAVTGELAGGTSTEGGRENGEANSYLLRIQGDNRVNLGIRYAAADSLSEAQRDIVSNNRVNADDVGQYRSLLPSTQALTLNGVLARPLTDQIQMSLNGTFGYTTSDSDQGLPTGVTTQPDKVRQQSVRGLSGHFGSNFGGAIGAWRWNLTGNYDHAESRTRTDRGVDIVLPGETSSQRLIDHAKSKSDIGNVQFVVAGTLFDLPAGPVTSSAKVGGELTGFDAQSSRFGVVSASDLSRNIASGQTSFDLPIASRRNNVLDAIGDLSLNLNLAADRVSHFSTLTTIGYGAKWTPIPLISFIASVTDDEGAPTVQQLGNPVVSTPNVRVYDYRTGTSVDITRITGGNPNLGSDKRHVLKLGFTLKPTLTNRADLSLTANYTKTRIKNSFGSFPTNTVEIEDAFPDRFVRDSSGRLLSIDSRPVQFAHEDRQQLRWGINFSKSLTSAAAMKAMEDAREARRAQMEKAREQREAAQKEQQAKQDGDKPADLSALGGQQPATPEQPSTRNFGGDGGNGGPGGGQGRGPGGFGGPGGPGGGRFGGGPPGGLGRMQLGVYHTWFFKNEILIRPGVPVLDLLDGSATGNNGGQPRHLIELQGGFTKSGLGARLSGSWQSGTTVRGGTNSATGDLTFSDFAKADLRLFADLGQVQSIAKDHPWVRGMRLSLAITNITNNRIKVRDQTGATPLSYQGGYLDPLGRAVKFEVRKLFF